MIRTKTCSVGKLIRRGKCYFLLHVTQQKTSYVVTDEGKTGNAKFSLVYTEVGPDAVGGDFFENVE